MPARVASWAISGSRCSPRAAASGSRPAVTLPLRLPYAPMEARLVDELPDGQGWQYEPKWDGFRCLAFRDGDAGASCSPRPASRSTRYFPDVVERLRPLPAPRASCWTARSSSRWTAPLLRRPAPAHPPGREPRRASSRAEHPAVLIVFDLLVDAARPLAGRPAAARAPASGWRPSRPSTLAGRDDDPPLARHRRRRRRRATGSTGGRRRSTACGQAPRPALPDRRAHRR